MYLRHAAHCRIRVPLLGPALSHQRGRRAVRRRIRRHHDTRAVGSLPPAAVAPPAAPPVVVVVVVVVLSVVVLSVVVLSVVVLSVVVLSVVARSARHRSTTPSSSTGRTGPCGPDGKRSHSRTRQLRSLTTSRTSSSDRRPRTLSGSCSISLRSCRGVGSAASVACSRPRYARNHQFSSSGRPRPGIGLPAPGRLSNSPRSVASRTCWSTHDSKPIPGGFRSVIPNV